MKVKVTQLCLTLCDPMNYSPCNSPGQNSGVGSHSFFQGIFLSLWGLSLLNQRLPFLFESTLSFWVYSFGSCLLGCSLPFVKSLSRVRLLRPHRLWPTRLLHPWDFPGKSTRVGCHCLLQRIFPTQGLNQGLLQYRQMLYRLSHQGSSFDWGTFPKTF